MTESEQAGLRPLTDFQVEAIYWIRPGWLARGKLTVLDGMPDVGKSTISADFAARASTGQPFPGGPGFGSPVGVLLAAAAEDGIGGTPSSRGCWPPGVTRPGSWSWRGCPATTEPSGPLPCRRMRGSCLT